MSYSTMIVLLEIGLLIAMPLTSEVAFRAGRRGPRDDAYASQIGIAQATTYAILGLLAAFTMSMAEARFSQRRQLILDEANAIGTTYLRSKYLIAPHPAELAPILRRYVDARVAFHAAGSDVAAAVHAMEDSERIQRELWAHTVAAVRDDPDHGDAVAEFVESLNATIDLENARTYAVLTHVPATVFALLVVFGLFGSAATGYSCGLTGRRVVLSVTLLPILAALAICVVLDLDSPRLGLITTGQRPLLRLQRTLAADAGDGDLARADPLPEAVLSPHAARAGDLPGDLDEQAQRR